MKWFLSCLYIKESTISAANILCGWNPTFNASSSAFRIRSMSMAALGPISGHAGPDKKRKIFYGRWAGVNISLVWHLKGFCRHGRDRISDWFTGRAAAISDIGDFYTDAEISSSCLNPWAQCILEFKRLYKEETFLKSMSRFFTTGVTSYPCCEDRL